MGAHYGGWRDLSRMKGELSHRRSLEAEQYAPEPPSMVHTSGGPGSNCPPTLGFALTSPPTPGLGTLGVSLLLSHNLDHLSKGSEVQRSKGWTEVM